MTEEIIKNITFKGKTKLHVSDVMFKAVFGRHQNVLLKMIRDVFEVEETEPFTIAGLESTPNTKSGKTYRGDITVRLSDKSYVLIEMNYRKDKNAIDRNMIHLTRVHNQILKKSVKDEELKDYRIRGLNLNNFNNETGEAIENYALCNIKTNKVVSLIFSFCNISLVKCRQLVYDINISNLPNAVRWGAILLEENIDKISQILGDDLLAMEEKESLLKTIEEVNDDKTVMQEWILEENARLKHEGQMNYAKEEGLKEGIEKGIEQGIEQGIEKGIEQGIKEEKVETVKKMINEGADYVFIAKITGKTTKEIEEIARNMDKETKES